MDFKANNTTPVYPLFWQFARNRMDIFLKRYGKQPPPWTHDTILQQYRFTNVFRASDRVSQYLIKHVIYPVQDYSDAGVSTYGLTDTVYRVLLFKLFNLPETWEYLEHKVGQIIWYVGCTDDYIKIIMELRQANIAHYNNAYMMQGRKMHKYGFESGYKFENHLRALEWMMENDLVGELSACQTMQQMYTSVLAQPYMGKFLAYQYVIDLCYSPYFNFGEDDFVMAGPGAERGLRKLFGESVRKHYCTALQWLVDNQEAEQQQLSIDPVTLFGRRLHLIDVQNLCCEIDKYTRVALPLIDHYGQKRIKQQYRKQDERPIELFFPPKWGINDNLVI